MNKNTKRASKYVIFMFSIALGFIAVDVVSHSTPNGKGVTSVQADTSWSK